MRDFTFAAYRELISSLEGNRYKFYTFEQFLNEHPSRSVILRHDVDEQPDQAILLAEFENSRSITASYHIRVFPVKKSNYIKFIKRIVELGHEIAYHYEDLTRTLSSAGRMKSLKFRELVLLKGIEKAKSSFISNLNWLREYYPVKVISMHGTPLSDIDNRILWDHMSYRELGVICEPYLDINYAEVLYLTDTGRRWDAFLSNRRDRILNKPEVTNNAFTSNKTILTTDGLHTTFNLINKIQSGLMPEKIIINTHPQRWTDTKIQWLVEYIGQNFRNFIKSILFRWSVFI